MGSLFQELQRRKVFRVGAVYAIVAWLLIQVSDTVLPALQMPEWTVSFVTVLFFLGFPIAIILAWAYEVTPEGIKANTEIQPQQGIGPGIDRKLIYATFALVLFAVGFQLTERFLLQSTSDFNNSLSNTVANPSSDISRLNLDNYDVWRMTTGLQTGVDITADGTQIVYSDSQESSHRLMRREPSKLEPEVLVVGPGFTLHPIISPREDLVLFENARGLHTISISEGASKLLVDDNSFSGGHDWLTQSLIVYTDKRNRLKTHAIPDGTQELLDTGPNRVSWPNNLPGTNSIVFSMETDSSGTDNNIAIHNLDTGETRTLIPNGIYPRYVVTGHLLFARDDALWATPFDLDSLQVTGEEQLVVNNLQTSTTSKLASYAVSDNGRLVYEPLKQQSSGVFTVPTWVNRSGQEEPLDLQAGAYRNPQLSPDYTRLALLRIEGEFNQDIWIFDFENEVLSRRTFSENVDSIVWSADGNELFYNQRSNEETGNSVWKINADGSGQPELLYISPDPVLGIWPRAITDNGSRLLVAQNNAGQLRELNYLTLDGSREITPVGQESFSAWGATVSSDGQWLGYSGFSSGIFTSFVRPFPDVDNGLWQIGTGIRRPIWDRELNSLYGEGSTANTLVEVHILSTSPFTTSEPEVIVSDIFIRPGQHPNYGISADGNRFLVLKLDTVNGGGGREQLNLVVIDNWLEELKRLAPPDPQ
ncbi:MAG: hypothetical protein COB20_16390 [SAR86 cluster bacterium]|uniref:Uncharacterized protein n=1 Tax=SAR86 cluster bacterium TaxID=2030880 RepID=A0A2A4WRT4_9GAMM|nr:MAG: hypothetical protein COB20_16390 [SAR86 cluster bacterium]